MTANEPSTPETAPGGPQERLEGVSAALASPEAPSGAQAPADGLGLRERITQTIRDTPARYPDDIAAAVWRVVQEALGEQPAPAATEATSHRYLSTGCLHGHHDYCQAYTGQSGQKTPAQCKFCAAPCVCPCHQDRP